MGVALLSLLTLTIDATWQVVDVVACFVVFKDFFLIIIVIIFPALYILVVGVIRLLM